MIKRIAILGCENSHANAFLKYITTKEEFSDIKVVGIYSNEPIAAQKLSDQYGIKIMNNYDDAVGQIDGLVITARHGDLHYPYAKPYIKSGIPMFIDKPITINESEALVFMRSLAEHEVKFTGGSSLKQDAYVAELKTDAIKHQEGATVGGLVVAPYIPDSPYGGFYFYAQHLVEIVCEIFGRYPKSVQTFKSDKKLTVVFRYNAYDAVGVFVEKGSVYHAARFTEKSVKGAQLVCSEKNDWFYNEFKEFHSILNGEAQKISNEDFIAPVFILNAIERSYVSGNEEAVNRFSL